MSCGQSTVSRSVGQTSVARRNAIARGWSSTSRAQSRDDHPDAIRAFTYQVAIATQGPVLRYSQRLRLLKLANDAGIARFDANLIIAAIENRRGASRAIEQPAERTRAFPFMFTAVCVQAMLILLAWAALLR